MTSPIKFDSGKSALQLDYARPKPFRVRLRGIHWLILGILLMIGAWLRFDGIGRQSEWSDEFWSVYISTGRGTFVFDMPGAIVLDPPPPVMLDRAPSWPHVWSGVESAVHPPLYFIVLRWWMDLFGEGDVATRSLSAIMSLAGVVVLFDAVRRQAGAAAGLLAAALMTMAAAQLYYSQETRGYTMLALLGLLICHAIIRIERGGATTNRLIELGLYVWAASLTHYFSACPLIAMLLYVLIWLRGTERKKTALAMIIGGAVALIMWSPELWAQRRLLTANMGWTHEIVHQSFMPLRRVIFNLWLNLTGHGDWHASIAIAIIVLALPLVLIRRAPHLFIWWVYVISTLGMVTAIDLARHSMLLFWVRYTFMATPGIYALLAMPLPMRSWLRWVLPAVMVFGVTIAAVAHVQEGSQPKEDWRRVVMKLDQLAGPGIVVFAPDDFMQSPAFWYLAFEHYVPSSQRPIMLLYHGADAKCVAQLKDYPAVWLIGPDPQANGSLLLPGWKPAGGFGVQFTGGVQRMLPIDMPTSLPSSAAARP